MRTPRGLERLNTFADAVVAIAITLLILPLVGIAASFHGNLGALLATHASQLFAFGLSFAVIARIWLVHHRITENLSTYNRAVLIWTMVWLFTIVFMPLPTELIGRVITRATAALYIATLLPARSACPRWPGSAPPGRTTRPGGSDGGDSPAERGGVGNPSRLALVLILALAVPRVSLYGLLLIFLEPWLARYVRRWSAHGQADSRREPSGPELGKITGNKPQQPDDG